MDNDRIRQAPARKFKNGRWYLPMTQANAMFIDKKYDSQEKSDETKKEVGRILGSLELPPIEGGPPEEIFGGCRPHQERAIRKAWGSYRYAFFHRMRTGKTFTTIRLAMGRHLRGQADRMLVICPISIKEVWENQLTLWWPGDEHSCHVYESGGSGGYNRWLGKNRGKFLVLIVGTEALSQGGAARVASEFCSGGHCIAVCDESTRIKNPTAGRTGKAWDIADRARFKLILTGSEITKGVEDLYSQYRFLGEMSLGHASYYTFRNRYCLLGGFQKKSIIGYTQLDELLNRAAAMTDIVEMKEVAPYLPPKIYQTRFVKPSKEQADATKSLKESFTASLGDDTMTVQGVLALLTRCQQICGGFYAVEVPSDDPTKKKFEPRRLSSNPKIDEIMELVDEIGGKVVIWARFRAEIAWIAESLAKRFGFEAVGQYHGGLSPYEREISKDQFQKDPSIRFLVANQQTGAMGVEFSAADTMIYFSNSFTYEDRKQSEERATSADKTSPVGIIDIVMDNYVDRNIIRNLQKKGDIAEWVKDSMQEIINGL